MRTTIVSMAALAGMASANIDFSKFVFPTCNYSQPLTWSNCLVGTHCASDNTCAINTDHSSLYPSSYHRQVIPSAPEKRQTKYSTDGTCGPANGNTICDPKSTVYKGSCCSQYGWCGNSADHCGATCISGCTAGDDTKEPVLGQPEPATPAAAAGKQTTDGTCGATNGNTICGNWPQGGCCSMYGFCGNTDSHCGTGCQSGPCKVQAQPAPGPSPAPKAAKPGKFSLLGRSGVPAMHAGLMPNGRVVFLDKIQDYTELKLANGHYAYSSEFDPATKKVVPLSYKTNAFCSGGIFLADGRFASLGGNDALSWLDPTVGNGFSGIRFLKRSSTDASLNGKAWDEPGTKLAGPRWYATAQIMADGSIFVASGSKNGLDPAKPENNNPTYEILNANGTPRGRQYPMAILEKNQPYYMYPFIHLLNTGNLFVFTSKSSEIFNVAGNRVVKTLPDLPGLFRTYPNTGGSVMLPLSSANNWNNDIVICGGGSWQDINSPTDPSCGRINALAANPTWEMDSMPEGRGMVEATLLPDGTVIWVNGANEGAQGFGLARKPTNQVLIYDPVKAKGKRWSTGPTSGFPRLYHSVALLLLDGTLLISGSAPTEMPVLKATAKDPYITEFTNSLYTPPYLTGTFTRPTNIKISNKSLVANSSKFTITFNTPASAKGVKITLYYGGFVTHSVHMGHRMLFLDNTGFKAGSTTQTVTVTMPPNKNVAPPGPYVVYVMLDGVPGIGQFVSVS